MEKFEKKYVLGKKLGFGAQAEVFLCHELHTARVFAVKLSKNVDEESQEMLRRQYDILKCFSH